MLGEILVYPILGTTIVLAESFEIIIGNTEHDLDASLREGLNDLVIGVEQLDLIDFVVLEQLNHHARAEVVGCLGSPVHAYGLDHVDRDEEEITRP